MAEALDDKLSRLRDRLVIDPDDLDTALTQQPQLFYEVAEQHMLANSKRDENKLILEEGIAEIDERIRRRALDDKEKLTEDLIKQRLRLQPKVKDLTRNYLAAKGTAERWLALKEAYEQRSYALKDLTARMVAQLNQLGMERGVTSSRNQLGDAADRQVRDARMERYRR